MADTLGYRKMIGIVVPSVNSAVQPECDEMRPEGVTNHMARIVTPKLVLKTDADFIKHVETMRAGIMDAVATPSRPPQPSEAPQPAETAVPQNAAPAEGASEPNLQ